MSAYVLGEHDWSLSVDKNYHRTYSIDWLVETTDPGDGPAAVANASGLPGVGSTWSFGNDIDAWAFCVPSAQIKLHQHKKGDPHQHWIVKQTFTTDLGSITRCWDEKFENPLLEPAKLSGGFAKYLKEATSDANGAAIVNVAFERYKGKLVEINDNHPTVSITFNAATLPLVLFSQYMDNTTNDATLWGLPKKTITLADCTWTENWYGTCIKYYTINYEFEINHGTWTRSFLNEGRKKLRPGGNINKPADFIVIRDEEDERITDPVPLTAAGGILGPGDPEVYLNFDLLTELNYLSLGIPATL